MTKLRIQPGHIVVLLWVVIIAAAGCRWRFRPTMTAWAARDAEAGAHTAVPTPTRQFAQVAEQAAQATDLPPTTILIVRHAEAAAQTEDPPLSADGQIRAQALAHVAGDAGVKAIYATQFIRTQETVQPLAAYLDLCVTQVDADDVQGLVDQVLSDHAGEVVLIAGHGDTVPAIIRELDGDWIPPMVNEFDNLYTVIVHGPGEAKVIHLNYGAPD